MATWMQRRLSRDPRSSIPSAPPEPESPTHARFYRALDAIMAAAQGRASEFPGGEQMAKLIMGKARKIMAGKSEAELRTYVQFLGRLSRSVETGEGFDELMEGGGENT